MLVAVGDAVAAEQTRVEQVGAGGIEHRDKGRALVKVARVGGMVKSRSLQHRVRCRREAGNWIVGVALVARISRDIGLAFESRLRPQRRFRCYVRGRSNTPGCPSGLSLVRNALCAPGQLLTLLNRAPQTVWYAPAVTGNWGARGKSGDVGAAGAVDGNGVGSSRRVVVQDTPANISGVDQLRACRVQLGDEARGRIRAYSRVGQRLCSGKSVDRV